MRTQWVDGWRTNSHDFQLQEFQYNQNPIKIKYFTHLYRIILHDMFIFTDYFTRRGHGTVLHRFGKTESRAEPDLLEE